MALFDDPLWPRAGDWPVQDGSRADLMLVDVPTSELSLSPSQVGQVEHPRPDSVSRTPAPTTVMTTSATSMARVIDR